MNNNLLPKLYVVGGSVDYAHYLLSQNDQVFLTLTKDPKEADLAMFTGGEDVNPALYNEPPGQHTYYSDRCESEVEFYNFFKENDIPMIGICRGLQVFGV